MVPNSICCRLNCRIATISCNIPRDQCVYAPSQWKMMLQCDVVSHRLGPFTKWSLHLTTLSKSLIIVKDNESGRIPNQISLKFVPRSPIDNKAALVQVMAWRRTGDNWRAITWTNANPVHCCIYAALREILWPGATYSGNGLLLDWFQAITGPNAPLLTLRPLAKNFCEIMSPCVQKLSI